MASITDYIPSGVKSVFSQKSETKYEQLNAEPKYNGPSYKRYTRLAYSTAAITLVLILILLGLPSVRGSSNIPLDTILTYDRPGSMFPRSLMFYHWTLLPQRICICWLQSLS